MKFTLLLRALIIATGFAGWPIVATFSKASGVWVGTIVLSFTAIVTVLLSGRGIISAPIPGYKAIAYLVIAGAINGVTCYLYSLTAADKEIQMGVFVALVSVLMVIIAPLISWMLNGELISSKQIAGLFLACISIYLIFS